MIATVREQIALPRQYHSQEAAMDGANRLLIEAGATDSREAALGLYGDFFGSDQKGAEGSLRVGNLSFRGAEVVMDRTQIPLDIDVITVSALLHDIGRTRIDRDVIEASNCGNYTSSHHERMKPHAKLGGDILDEAGLVREAPFSRAHHTIQPEPYGRIIDESDRARTISLRILVAADYYEAMVSRSNGRNRHLSPGERIDDSRVFMERYAFNEHAIDGDSRAIINDTLGVFVEMLPPVDEPDLRS